LSRRLAATVAAAVLAVAVLAGCTSSPAGIGLTFDDSGYPSFSGQGKAAPPTELEVNVVTEGKGDTVQVNQAIEVRYVGWLWDTGEIFDSYWKPGETAYLVLAKRELIDGWVEGLAGQKVGSVVQLIIPPDKAYGDQDLGTVPPNSTLVFAVEIVAAGDIVDADE
jgi:peptidylprolyl isomerase